jgi:predicted nucleotidyltransferase
MNTSSMAPEGVGMSLEVSAMDMERYRASAQARWRSERAQCDVRRQRAWRLTSQAAELLRTQYGVPHIAVFGSLTHPDRFTQWSDVDLAAWGLTATNWLKASAAVRALASDIELNVVDVSGGSPELLAAIVREGVPL